jgi:gas vesicle protein
MPSEQYEKTKHNAKKWRETHREKYNDIQKQYNQTYYSLNQEKLQQTNLAIYHKIKILKNDAFTHQWNILRRIRI